MTSIKVDHLARLFWGRKSQTEPSLSVPLTQADPVPPPPQLRFEDAVLRIGAHTYRYDEDLVSYGATDTLLRLRLTSGTQVDIPRDGRRMLASLEHAIARRMADKGMASYTDARQRMR